ncbi:E3 ubiquitin-protein ligase At3g02290-like isoform X2 [Phragmites australis]|uniref:E3 ubiquitin-protein ligase At3g02290-like isoform X2 n=1 Tax=Phragmites australis TaxID=29695 RepID=UPI002D76641D|nr:E3 ubiquitin-protein ligase At3g02290-like isoform X2 [Phragmites australis]
MGCLLCCLRGNGDPEGGVCCFCLPWPFLNNSHSGSAARQRGDTRVAPDHGRLPLVASTATGQVDSMDTFHSPPRPLPYDDPQFSSQIEQHPVVSGHDKASMRFQKPGQLTESQITDTGSTCTAQKLDGSSVKYHSGGPRTDGRQACVSSDNEDDCPICLEGNAVQ